MTITYNEAEIPINENGQFTLRKEDAKNFIKEVRAAKDYYKDKTPFKTIYCGEYGSNYGRPHMHLCLLGLSDAQADAYTRKKWTKGIIDVGTLGQGGIRYVIDYMQKTQFNMVTKLTNEAMGIENPFLNHSIELGKNWIIRNEKKIIEEQFTFVKNGKRCLFPKYVMEWVGKRNGIDYRPIVADAMRQKWNCQNNWRELELEDALLKEKWLIETARRNGNMVQKWQLAEKRWLKPKMHSRIGYDLATQAIEAMM